MRGEARSRDQRIGGTCDMRQLEDWSRATSSTAGRATCAQLEEWSRATSSTAGRATCAQLED